MLPLVGSTVYFNSSVVRLKADGNVSIEVSSAVFQFQCGTIKSVFSCSFFCSFFYFNSSVVRLKELIRTLNKKRR